MSKLPKGALTFDELVILRRDRNTPNLRDKRFHIVRHTRESGLTSGEIVGDLQSDIGQHFSFNVTSEFYYFDNYWHAYAFFLRAQPKNQK